MDFFHPRLCPLELVELLTTWTKEAKCISLGQQDFETVVESNHGPAVRSWAAQRPPEKYMNPPVIPPLSNVKMGLDTPLFLAEESKRERACYTLIVSSNIPLQQHQYSKCCAHYPTHLSRSCISMAASCNKPRGAGEFR